MVKRIEYNNGTIEYRNVNGELHREDGPAVIWGNGKKYWCKNGKVHREDGPAVMWDDGSEFWWLNGIQYSFDKWIEKVNISNEYKLELILRYG